MSKTEFPLGQIVATPGALKEIERLTGNSSQTLAQLLARHPNSHHIAVSAHIAHISCSILW